jgi:hypothetical protein
MVYLNDLLAELIEAGYVFTIQQDITRKKFSATLVNGTTFEGQAINADLATAMSDVITKVFTKYQEASQ